jgi:hypothetical protein
MTARLMLARMREGGDRKRGKIPGNFFRENTSCHGRAMTRVSLLAARTFAPRIRRTSNSLNLAFAAAVMARG